MPPVSLAVTSPSSEVCYEQPPRLSLKLWPRVAQWKEKPQVHITWLLFAAGEAQSRSPQVPPQTLLLPGKKINHQEGKL